MQGYEQTSNIELQRNSKEASQLLSEAKLTEDSSDRQYLLSQVFEKIFYREKVPNLLRDFFYPLLEYENDKSPSIRKYIISVLEEIVLFNRQEALQCKSISFSSYFFKKIQLFLFLFLLSFIDLE